MHINHWMIGVAGTELGVVVQVTEFYSSGLCSTTGSGDADTIKSENMAKTNKLLHSLYLHGNCSMGASQLAKAWFLYNLNCVKIACISATVKP